jgi:hypothetical protein
MNNPGGVSSGETIGLKSANMNKAKFTAASAVSLISSAMETFVCDMSRFPLPGGRAEFNA